MNTQPKFTPKCETCGGTGWQLLMRSWFVSDGVRRERCGICAGSGISSHRDDPRFIRWQAEQRAALAKVRP